MLPTRNHFLPSIKYLLTFDVERTEVFSFPHPASLNSAGTVSRPFSLSNEYREKRWRSTPNPLDAFVASSLCRRVAISMSSTNLDFSCADTPGGASKWHYHYIHDIPQFHFFTFYDQALSSILYASYGTCISGIRSHRIDKRRRSVGT